MTWHDTIFIWLYKVAMFQIGDVYLCQFVAIPYAILLYALSRLAQSGFFKIMGVAIGLCFYYLPNVFQYWAK